LTSSLSEIDGCALCNPLVVQVAGERHARKILD
jgi:hypothetical protein